MRYRNKYKIDFSDNALKKDPILLGRKNALEAQWYDREAEAYLAQLNDNGEPLKMDLEYERNIGSYYDNPSYEWIHDRNFCFFQKFSRQPGQKMLDLGSGNGILSRFLIRRGMEVVSVDVSPKVCQFLVRSDARCLVVRSCAECLPFGDESFDVVTSLVSLHHFNLKLSLQEVWRVLKQGGVGVFMEPLLNSQLLYKLRQFVPIEDTESPGGGGLCVRELEVELENAGFDYRITKYELLTRLQRLPCLGRFEDALRRTDFFLFSRFPFLRRFARLAIIEMRKR